MHGGHDMTTGSKPTRNSPQFEALLGRLRAFMARCDELAGLSRQDLEGIAHELNLSTSDFRALARAPDSPELLRTRLAHAGLAEHALAASHGDVLRDLQRGC